MADSRPHKSRPTFARDGAKPRRSHVRPLGFTPQSATVLPAEYRQAPLTAEAQAARAEEWSPRPTARQQRDLIRQDRADDAVRRYVTMFRAWQAGDTYRPTLLPLSHARVLMVERVTAIIREQARISQ